MQASSRNKISYIFLGSETKFLWNFAEEKSKFISIFRVPLPPLPLTIYLYPSWQQAEADQLWTGRIAAGGIAPLCGPAREKFSRDLNLYARKWKLLRGFDRIYSTKTLCSYFISCANKFFSLFSFFFFQIQNFIGIKNRNYKITQLFQTDANLSANSSSSWVGFSSSHSSDSSNFLDAWWTIFRIEIFKFTSLVSLFRHFSSFDSRFSELEWRHIEIVTELLLPLFLKI